MVDLSICIVTYNVTKIVDELLTSIYQKTIQLDFEVLIVDNDSTDGIDEIVKKYPNVNFVKNKVNVFFTKADNQNLKRARGKYIVSLNPDTLILPGTLEKMVGFLELNPDVGAVTPKFFFPDGIIQKSIGRFPNLIYGIFEAIGINTFFPENKINRDIMTNELFYDPDKIQEASVLYGACIMIRREVLDTVGLKDEKFIHGWDEYDWCKRIAQKGWRLCYLPDAIVVHHCGASRKQVTSNISLDKYHWDGLFYLYKKHFGYSTYVLLRFLRYLSTILKKTKIIDGLNILMEKKKWRGL
ncbi:MAG: glycosyltransferase family 2 protein [Candidatus Methanoperedenaceae archaeon]|nr:glycosyltransferase family 2 protein [Candidatus Methanoperedenaceae archaeon]